MSMGYNPYFQQQQYGQTFPPSYNTPYQQNMMQSQINTPMVQMPVQQVQDYNNDMIWVQGEAGMKAYVVARNSTVVLWDSENPVIYIKSADSSGKPTTRILDWTERNTAPQFPQPFSQQKETDFVKREEFDSLLAQFNKMSEKFEEDNNNGKSAV